MNIVILSDLNWEAHLRTVTPNEILEFRSDQLAMHRYERVRRYFEIVIKEKADLVLLAGDVTGDGLCGRGFQYALILLLQLLEQENIPTLFISGNHDPDENYIVVKDWIKKFNNIQEISGQLCDVYGLNILGVNYDTSNSKSSLRKMLAQQNKKIDIVLAHSVIKRRINHFDFDCDYIITGHYDRKLLAHRNKVFIALDNDSEEVSYAVINKNEKYTDQLSIKIKKDGDTLFSLTDTFEQLISGNRNSILEVNGYPTFDLLKLENANEQSISRDGAHYLYLKYLRGINYTSCLDTMYRMKNNLSPTPSDLSLNQLHGLPITSNYEISESMIEDYLGDVIE